MGGGLDGWWDLDKFVRSGGWVVFRNGKRTTAAWREGVVPSVWEPWEASLRRSNGARQWTTTDLLRGGSAGQGKADDVGAMRAEL